MPKTNPSLIRQLPKIRKAAESIFETMLANLVMISEIPAPTFGEHNRIRFLEDRFSECGLANCSIDEIGNGYAILPGSQGERNTLVVAHADTIFSEKDDHTITVGEDFVTGPAVGDNSVGLAAVATLPTLFETLGIQLKNNLVLMGTVRSLGRGDIEGLRFFCSNTSIPISHGVCVEGVQLGRLNYSSVGMLRGEVNVDVPDTYDWTRFGASGAVRIINDVVNRINAIPLPRRPRTSILIGSIHSGSSFSTVATQALLRFEIRSESSETGHWVGQQIKDIAAEISAQSGTDVKLDIFAKREPGGVHFGHPIVRQTRAIMNALDIEPRIAPSLSELATFIEHQVPAVTLGITKGERLHKNNEIIHIPPIYTGLAQLVGVLLAIDEEGCNDEND